MMVKKRWPFEDTFSIDVFPAREGQDQERIKRKIEIRKEKTVLRGFAFS